MASKQRKVTSHLFAQYNTFFNHWLYRPGVLEFTVFMLVFNLAKNFTEFIETIKVVKNLDISSQSCRYAMIYSNHTWSDGIFKTFVVVPVLRISIDQI